MPGAIVDFTLVVDKTSSYVEGIRIRHFQSVEQDPLAARRLALFKEIVSGTPRKALAVGESVPDFTLTDSKSRQIALSQFRRLGTFSRDRSSTSDAFSTCSTCPHSPSKA